MPEIRPQHRSEIEHLIHCRRCLGNCGYAPTLALAQKMGETALCEKCRGELRASLLTEQRKAFRAGQIRLPGIEPKRRF